MVLELFTALIWVEEMFCRCAFAFVWRFLTVGYLGMGCCCLNADVQMLP